MKKLLIIYFLIFFLLMACARVVPIRESLREDIKIPSGRIEGTHFIGIRYPFKVEAPINWRLTTDFPNFLREIGYEEPAINSNEQTELYIFNPETRSNIQFDITPADQYTKFSQEFIERLTTIATESLKQELKEELGKEIGFTLSPTIPINLKGVQFAAKKYVRYSLKDEKREQGWIYGFREPYQIFILYMVIEKEGYEDRKDIEKIIEGFEFF